MNPNLVLTFKKDTARRFVSHKELLTTAEYALGADLDHTIEHHPYGGYLMKVNHKDRPREYLGYYDRLSKGWGDELDG